MNQETTPIELSLDPRQRATYTIWTSHSIRYNDQDPIGHVNNAVYSTFFEAGRTAFMSPLIKEVGDPSIDFVLARITIDYVKEMNYPGTAEIGTRISRLGTKSMTFINGIFTAGANECNATCEAVLVFFDLHERRSTEPPPALRQKLEKLLRA